MKKGIAFSVLLCLTLAHGEGGKQLDKQEILEILTKSAKTPSAKRKKHKNNKNVVASKKTTTNTTNIKSKSSKVKNTKEAEIRSGIIYPNSSYAIKRKEVDPYKNLPFGQLPDVSINSHIVGGVSLEKRYKYISGEIDEAQAVKKPKPTTKKKTDPVEMLY